MNSAPWIRLTLPLFCLLLTIGCFSPAPSKQAAAPVSNSPPGTVDRVRAIVAEQFDLDVGRITVNTSLGELGADELDLVEIVMELEEEFDVTIPDEAVGGTIGPPEWTQKMDQMTMEQLAKIVEPQKPK